MTESVLECRDLVKVYAVGSIRRRRIEALRGVTLSVHRGDVYGFLGENGAGKTTTIRCLLGLTHPTSGEMRVFGRDRPGPRELFSRAAYCPEESNFFTGITGRELLRLYGRLHGLAGAELEKRVDRALDEVDLRKNADRRIEGYSKRMRQRVGLAQAVLPQPELIILDEPARGLDPVGRRRFRDVILDHAARGTTFFINSHTLSEVERTCTRVGIIKSGRVIRELAPRDLVEDPEALEIIYEIPGEPLGGSERADGQGFRLRVQGTAAMAEAAAEIARRGGRVESAGTLRKSLEDYFIQVVGDEDVVS
ncbi:MAG: ABC transporter ATP-binding protein [Deltaproteobacteria bacterium]|nr:ABC transporter ATP-binding protein [Deltaproteobacteria bacterium]